MRWLPALALTLALAACTGDPGTTASTGSEDLPREVGPTVTLSPSRPLAGRTVVIDPGHQLGNGAHPTEINALVDAGGFMKACNTTGTATSDGYPEATFTWQVALELRRQLRVLGARVVLTRSSNSEHEWGPCVDERGRSAARGDLMVSLHGDGSLAPDAHGFHVISAPGVKGSQALARDLRAGLVAAGLTPSTYTGVRGLDSREDLGTLNLAERPAVMVELGNMRHLDDASLMTSRRGRARYADALVSGIRRHLR